MLDYPMKPGMIDSWTDVEDLWEYMLYSALGVSEGDHPVVLTEIAHNPVKNREKVAEVGNLDTGGWSFFNYWIFDNKKH